MDIQFMTKKLIAAFFILIIYIKVSGRKQLAPLSPTDQIGNMVMGALISNSIVSVDVSIMESIIIVSIWAGLQLFLRYLKFKSGVVTEIIDGKKYQLMKNGIIQPKAFKDAQMSLLDFENSIHNQDVKSISEIRNAWFDSTGNITLDLKTEENQSNVLIFNGNIHIDALNRLDISKEKLMEKLKEKEIHEDNLDDILCLELYKNKLYIYHDEGTDILKI